MNGARGMESKTKTARATGVGLWAIPIWSLLPALTVAAGNIPPLELLALTFTIGTVAGLGFLTINARARKDLGRIDKRALLLGTAGLFGFHFAYFLALQNAPPAEANLIDYLWPVLIVVFASALPSQANAGVLTFQHLFGAAIAFAGAALAITSGKSLSLGGNAFGYGMALLAAVIWSAYSVATRLFDHVPSAAVVFYSAFTAVLAWGAHAALEKSVWTIGASHTAAIIALGIGPLGVAFYVWDYGCKHGDLRILGISAYFAPLLSTAVLMAAGLSPFSMKLALAAILITGGALISSGIYWRGARAGPALAEGSKNLDPDRLTAGLRRLRNFAF